MISTVFSVSSDTSMAPKTPVQRGEVQKDEKPLKWFFKTSIYSLAFVAGILSSVLIKDESKNFLGETAGLVQYQDPPNYWLVSTPNSKGNLSTADTVFDRLGFHSVNATKNDDWDVLWSVENPFNANDGDLYEKVTKPLQPHQRVNHFPGSNILTDRTKLSTRNREMAQVLPGFDFSQGEKQIKEFKDYVKANPKTDFIEKSKNSREFKIVKSDNIAFENNQNFYQVFMDTPFLIDNHALELSVFVLISSIDPIRIYRFNQDIQVRFCDETYYPFDAKNVSKFVVSETKDLFAETPSLKDYGDRFGFSTVLTFDDFLSYNGYNVGKMWEKIDNSLVRLIVSSEPNIVKEVSVFIFHRTINNC